jgi:hypothetical protein
MKSLSTKLVLSALGLALLAGPADAQIRSQLTREWDFRYGE